ncbi:DUF1214 domain-containing protein [Streptomyces sp. NPDC005529]
MRRKAQFFWSPTLNRLPERLLADNALDRCSIGDHTEGLAYDRDGSLTPYVQHARPDAPHRAASWLPVADGPCSVGVRICGPNPSVLPPGQRVIETANGANPLERIT